MPIHPIKLLMRSRPSGTYGIYGSLESVLRHSRCSVYSVGQALPLASAEVEEALSHYSRIPPWTSISELGDEVSIRESDIDQISQGLVTNGLDLVEWREHW